MVGLKESRGFPSLNDGEWVQYLIVRISPPQTYLNSLADKYAAEVEKADALGLPVPVKPEPSVKDGGLEVELAIIARGHDSTEPYERTVTYEGGLPVMPDYRSTVVVRQKSLPEVFAACEALRQAGKTYGYNFQRDGIVKVRTGNTVIPEVGYLHANPNPAKDWAANISANQVDWEDQKYADLVQKEQARLDEWKADIAAWNALSEDEAREEILEALSRRLGLYKVVDGVVMYIPPTIGMTFVARLKVKDKGYLEINTMERPSGGKWTVFTKNVYEPTTSEDVDRATDVAMAIQHRIMMFQSKKAAKVVAQVPMPLGDEDEEDVPW